VDGDYLRSKLMEAQNKMSDTNRLKFWKGRRGNEREID
jgi:diadenylate cyclase